VTGRTCMKYVCQMCAGFERGADTREGFVAHMALYHRVTITVEDILYIEGHGRTARSEGQRRRRERERRESRERSQPADSPSQVA
jgi:hypothetical protein